MQSDWYNFCPEHTTQLLDVFTISFSIDSRLLLLFSINLSFIESSSSSWIIFRVKFRTLEKKKKARSSSSRVF